MSSTPPPRRFLRIKGLRRVAVLLGLLALFGTIFGSLDLQPSLRRVKLAVLSGTEGGNYHKVVAQLSEAAARDRGHITNIATQGSVENIERLAAARQACDVQFALVQDGLEWPDGLELLARLPRAESVFILGRETERFRTLQDFGGLRVGIGPAASGTNRLVRALLQDEDLDRLHLSLSNHALEEQLERVQDGSLDLAVLVMDEDAPLIVGAVRDRGLSILSLPQADVIARRLPRVRTGRIGAGQYDPVRLLPPVDKTVLRVETLIVGNGCARRSATTGLLTLLSREFPDFTRRNQDTPNTTGLPLSSASRSYFENGGPDLASMHLPWAVDLMPVANWIYAITAVSLSFNLMAMWSRFRLWRLDARRAEVEDRLERLFHANITTAELASLQPALQHLTAGHQAELRDLIDALAGLRALCRKQASGWVADMGEELPYRYQEHLMADLMRALRSFQARCEETAHAKGFQRV